MLLTGIAYAAANFGMFVATISMDKSAIFARGYMISVVLVGPAVMLVASNVVAGFLQRVLGFAIWIGCVGFAHLWIIAAASASI